MSDEQARDLECRLVRIENQVDKIAKLLTGNGEPERGHIVRIDRLERVVRAITWVVSVTVASAITAATAAVVAYVRNF